MSNKIKLSDFVFTDNLIGSREIAKKLGRRHDQVSKHINKYRSDIENAEGSLICKKTATGGRPVDEFYLTKAQFYFMILLMENRDKTVELKFQIVQEYMDKRKRLFGY